MRRKILLLPVLSILKFIGHFTVDSDLSDNRLGSFLLHEREDKHLKHIGYWSGSLSSAARSNSMIQKVSRNVLWSTLVLHPFIESTHFTIRTDHQGLEVDTTPKAEYRAPHMLKTPNTGAWFWDNTSVRRSLPSAWNNVETFMEEG